MVKFTYLKTKTKKNDMKTLTTTTAQAKKEVFNLEFMGWSPKRKEIKFIKKTKNSCTLDFEFEVIIQSPCNSLESCVWFVNVSFDLFDGDYKTFQFQKQNILN